jgi:hypothetical protein
VTVLQLRPGLPASDSGQRWRDGDTRWVCRTDLFTPEQYAVTALDDDTTPAEFIHRHHYAGVYVAAKLRYGLIDQDTGDLAGVAVMSVPAQKKVLTTPFPGLRPYTQSLELGRFVLLDQVGFNGETWFLNHAFREYAAAAGIRGVVSFSDPVARTTAAGETVFLGHIGGIYQASNARYCGRSTPRTLCLLPDGTVLSARALQKVRKLECGHDYVERVLVGHGARPRLDGQDPRRWLREALDAACVRRARHPGNHRYCFLLGDRAERRRTELALPAGPYPKRRPPTQEAA